MDLLDFWADQLGVVCLHDTKCIENPWMNSIISDGFMGIIQQALQPSLRFKVLLQASQLHPFRPIFLS